MSEVPGTPPADPTPPAPPIITDPDGKPPVEAKKPPEAITDKPVEKKEPANILADDDEKKPDGDPPKIEEKPVEYKDFKLPDGFELVPESLDGFKKLAAESKLSQDSAQSLLDMHVEAIQSVVEQMTANFNESQEEWQKAVKADKEIGGNNLASVKATVSKALDQFGAPGVREALKLTGAGNHPEIVRTFYRMAQALTEGGIIKAETPRGPQRTMAQRMYPEMVSELEKA